MNKFLILVWLMVFGVVTSTACEHTEDERPVILIVGDSLSSAFGLELSQGWAALLEQRLKDRSMNYRVINASISGDTTSGGLARLKKSLPDVKPALVVIGLGGNDGLRGMPLKSMRRNLHDMITISAEQGALPVLLGMRIPSNYGPRYTERFHAIYNELATEHDVPHISFFMQNIALQPELMQSDGIHPNAQAQATLLENAWPAIESGLKRLAP